MPSFLPGVPRTSRSSAPPGGPAGTVRPGGSTRPAGNGPLVSNQLGTSRPRPGSRPSAKPGFTYMDSTFLSDQNHLDYQNRQGLGEINAGLAALRKRDPMSGRTLFDQRKWEAEQTRASDSSQGHGRLAGRNILFSGARDNMDARHANAYAKSELEAYNEVGKGAEDTLLQAKQKQRAEYVMLLQALQAAAAARSREAGGPPIPRGQVGYSSVGAQ